MGFHVSKDAANWYKTEMDLEDGDYIQYYLQIYGGIPTSLPNYSLGMSVGKAGEVAIKTVVEGITFYFNDENAWLFNEYDVKVDLEEEEIRFDFKEK